ncbi:MAG: type IV pilus biogenesis/stability protein PilW [Gammaproteobacteria bacterium]|nr:MAG: type IV pilus biogenesis/stability protein PilW [Gammaproteobacteria bacterium]
MKLNTSFLVACVASSMFVGCVTTDSGTSAATPSDDAAEQNYNLGTQYFRNGNYDLARDRLERATKLDPKYAEAHSMLAMTLVRLDKIRLATESFNRAVRLEPDNFNVRNAYGVFLCQQKQYDEAREQFDRAAKVRVNDNAEIMLTNAGVCMAEKPDHAVAEAYFRAALEIRPTYGEALIQLASLMHVTADDLKARAFLQRYLAGNEATAAVLYLGVQIEATLGDDRAADDYRNQIFTDFPDSAEARQLRIERP